MRPWSLNCSIVPVFWSPFEVSFQNISPLSNRIKPKLFETLSDATKSNAQRNKLSLHATTYSGISHFRKTHLKRHEVVMKPADDVECDLHVAWYLGVSAKQKNRKRRAPKSSKKLWKHSLKRVFPWKLYSHSIFNFFRLALVLNLLNSLALNN